MKHEKHPCKVAFAQRLLFNNINCYYYYATEEGVACSIGSMTRPFVFHSRTQGLLSIQGTHCFGNFIKGPEKAFSFPQLLNTL